MKNILVQFSFTNMTEKQYNQVTAPLESVGKGNIPARLYHVAAANDSGWHITDVWQSEEDFNNFADTMMPILVKSGVVQTEPVILTVHNIIAS